MQQQGRPQRPAPSRDMSQMSNREIEKLLGQQYAQMLKDNSAAQSAMKDREEVIQGSMHLLESYNKIALQMKMKTAQNISGFFK